VRARARARVRACVHARARVARVRACVCARALVNPQFFLRSWFWRNEWL